MCIDDLFRKDYTCECPKGWTGNNCEEKTVTCAEKPCVHGTCRDTSTGMICTCPIGYNGKYCDMQIDECKPNPCENNGRCSSIGNDYKCTCPSGFTGMNCEINIDDCDGSPCVNGGTCVDMINQYRCQCVAGYIGANCASKVDLCLTKPCANGGTCTNLNNDYRCECRSGFTGKDCSIDIDECSSMPCLNGGTCVNRVNSYQCVCPGGFRGHNCQDEAASYTNHDPAHISTTQAYSIRSDSLSKGQVALIAILSIAMPMVVIVAACVVYCMKQKRKRDQEKEDAEARKQNERNASAVGHSSSSKRSSSSGLAFDSNNPTIIKNTWDKSVNNISSSASVDECLMSSTCYGGPMTNYGENDCFTSTTVNSTISPLQRAKSQKQLNTDPSVMHRASQIIHTKDYVPDHKRVSCIGGITNTNSNGNCGTTSLGDTQMCSQRWQPQTISTSGSPLKSYGPSNPSHM